MHSAAQQQQVQHQQQQQVQHQQQKQQHPQAAQQQSQTPQPQKKKTYSRSTTNEQSLREELELIAQENRQLSRRVEKLAHENVELKRVLFQLNVHFSQLIAERGNSPTASPSSLGFAPVDLPFFDLDKHQTEIEELLHNNAHLVPFLSHAKLQKSNLYLDHPNTDGIGSDTLSPLVSANSDGADVSGDPKTSNISSVLPGGRFYCHADGKSNAFVDMTSGGFDISGTDRSHRAMEGARANSGAEPITMVDNDPNAMAFDRTMRKRAGSSASYGRHRAHSSARDARSLRFKFELGDEHNGAIYNIRFSEDGHFLASCSHDKSVIIWNVTTQEMACRLEGHEASVLDIGWSNDETEPLSNQLVSGGIDHMVKLWDVTTAKETASFRMEGLVQSVQLKYGIASNSQSLIFAADTRKNIIVYDVRQQNQAVHLTNDVMVNCVHANHLSEILTGDNLGMLKIWDMRQQSCLDSAANDPHHSPISGICFSSQPNSERNISERYRAVNSYDNVLRVYDRGSLMSSTKLRQKLIHELKGHKNQNWPIKSSMFVGKDYDPRTNTSTRTSGSTDDPPNRSFNNSMLLASGSTDAKVYVYDISTTDSKSDPIQVLEGHKDIVYSTAFHPNDPVLATCSGDMRIKFFA